MAAVGKKQGKESIKSNHSRVRGPQPRPNTNKTTYPLENPRWDRKEPDRKKKSFPETKQENESYSEWIVSNREWEAETRGAEDSTLRLYARP